MEYYPSKFKILDFIKSVQNDVFVEAEEQKVELEIEIEKSLKNKSIYYDKDRLKQVFINLISNAIKFTPENKKVIVKASQREKNILFEIIDN
jgi:multi-sensor signal transduction histidine kinase